MQSLFPNALMLAQHLVAAVSVGFGSKQNMSRDIGKWIFEVLFKHMNNSYRYSFP